MRHILSTFFCLLGMVSVAYGAEVELPKGYNPLAELEIGAFPESPEIVSASLSTQEEQTISVSFALSVEEGIHPQTDVRLALAKKGEGSETFAYETKGEGGYTLGSENSPLKGVITHTFPDTLKGDYTLYLLMRDRGGVVTAVSPVGALMLGEVVGSGDVPTTQVTTRAPLSRVVITESSGGREVQVLVREQERTLAPRTLEVKTYGSEGVCGTSESRGVENRMSVVRMPVTLGESCREPVTLLTLRENTGTILDEVRVSHAPTVVPEVPREYTVATPAQVPESDNEKSAPLVLYVALFGGMVLLLILGVLIRKYKKDEKQALSPRLLLVIALMALFFSVGTHFTHAGGVNFMMFHICGGGACPMATTVFFNVSIPVSVDANSSFPVQFVISSDDSPQPTFAPLARYRVTDSAPYSADMIPEQFTAGDFIGGTILTHTVSAPSTPGTHTFCASVGLSGYMTPPVKCTTYTVNDITPPPPPPPPASCDRGCEGDINFKPCASVACDLEIFSCPLGTRMVITSGSCSDGRVGLAGVTCVSDSSCSVPPPPPAPSTAPSPFAVNANTTCSSGEITTTWGSVGGATGYDIEVNGAVTTGVSSPFIQNGIGDNITRSYRVRATNGGGVGPWTSTQSGTTAGACATPPLVPTGVVANPNTTPPGSGVITVSWNPSPGATSYTIRDNGVVISSGSGATTFDHTGLTPGSNHSYTVDAVNGAGPSGESAPVPATATVGAPLPPAPSGLNPQPGAPGSGEILITWNPVPGASGYTLHETVTGNTVTIPGTTYTHGGRTPGSTYTYVVRTETPSGSSSGWSPPQSAVAPSAVPPPPGSSCTPWVDGLCTISATGNNGDTAGSCVPLGTGSCSYTCNGTTGTWEPTSPGSNQCTGPAIDELHICTDATETNCNNDGSGMGGSGSSVHVCYNSSNADACELNPASLGTGGAQDSCVQTTLGAIAGNPVTLTCYNLDGSNPVSPVSSSLTPVPPPPPPTLSLSKSIVKRNSSVTLSWNTNGPLETSCTLTGAGVSTNTLVTNGGNPTLGDVTVPVQGRTTFEITCGGQSGKVTVDIIPEGYES